MVIGCSGGAGAILREVLFPVTRSWMNTEHTPLAKMPAEATRKPRDKLKPHQRRSAKGTSTSSFAIKWSGSPRVDQTTLSIPYFLMLRRTFANWPKLLSIALLFGRARISILVHFKSVSSRVAISHKMLCIIRYSIASICSGQSSRFTLHISGYLEPEKEGEKGEGYFSPSDWNLKVLTKKIPSIRWHWVIMFNIFFVEPAVSSKLNQ